jgi:hypothetical protein
MAAVFVVVLTIYGVSPAAQNFDSYLGFPTAWEIVHHQTLYLDDLRVPTVTGNYAYGTVSGGHHADTFPWADSLWLVPGVVAADAGHALGLSSSSRTLIERNHMDALQVACASTVTALAAVLVWLIAYRRLTGDDRRRRRLATLVSLGFAVGTGAWSTASRAMWQHGPSLLALAVAVLMADRLASRSSGVRWRAAVLGAALAAAYAFRPTNAVAVVGFTLWLVWRYRRLVAWELVGAAVVAVPWLLVNVATFGSMLPPYNSGNRISLHSKYGEALLANLVSPSRGLLVYAPVVLFAVVGLVLGGARQDRSLDFVLGACIVAHLFVVAGLEEHWWAGHAYGPRFMTDMMVLAAALATPAVDKLAVAWRQPRRSGTVTMASGLAVVALGWSVFANSQGALTRVPLCWNVDPVNIDAQPQRVWAWSDPQFSLGVRRLAADHSVRQAVLGHCQHTVNGGSVGGRGQG